MSIFYLSSIRPLPGGLHEEGDDSGLVLHTSLPSIRNNSYMKVLCQVKEDLLPSSLPCSHFKDANSSLLLQRVRERKRSVLFSDCSENIKLTNFLYMPCTHVIRGGFPRMGPEDCNHTSSTPARRRFWLVSAEHASFTIIHHSNGWYGLHSGSFTAITFSLRRYAITLSRIARFCSAGDWIYRCPIDATTGARAFI